MDNNVMSDNEDVFSSSSSDGSDNEIELHEIWNRNIVKLFSISFCGRPTLELKNLCSK